MSENIHVHRAKRRGGEERSKRLNLESCHLHQCLPSSSVPERKHNTHAGKCNLNAIETVAKPASIYSTVSATRVGMTLSVTGRQTPTRVESGALLSWTSEAKGRSTCCCDLSLGLSDPSSS